MMNVCSSQQRGKNKSNDGKKRAVEFFFPSELRQGKRKEEKEKDIEGERERLTQRESETASSQTGSSKRRP